MAITKCINSESKQYKPVLTDKLVLDAVPTVNSLNGVTSDAVARAIAGASGEVPQVTENDNGKVLKAIYDAGGPAVEWGEATVDQTYDATSSNAQSGVAVAQAIAAIPSEVSTASGHFDLEGSVPVTVNYTGTPHVIPGSQTLSNPVITDIGQGFAVNFSLEGLSTLDANESATLTLPSNAPAYANFDVFYSDSSSAAGGPPLTSSPALPNTESIASAGNYTLTGTNPVPSYGAYVGMFLMLSEESDRSAMKEWASTLTINWPASVVDGYETTIPVVDQNYHAESTNAQSGVAVAQAIAAIPSTSYTAGNGIDITSNTVSVKAGTGLEIDDISIPGSTANLVSQDIQYNEFGDSYDVLSIAPLTSGLLSQMSNGLDVTTVGEFYNSTSNTYAALYELSGNTLGNRLVLGSALSSTDETIAPGTVITFDTGDIDAAKSTVTLSQVESNISNYRLGLLYKDGSRWEISWWSQYASTPSVTTATYTEMTTVHDALCVTNPIQQVNALPANPDANTLYLIPEA